MLKKRVGSIPENGRTSSKFCKVLTWALILKRPEERDKRQQGKRGKISICTKVKRFVDKRDCNKIRTCCSQLQLERHVSTGKELSNIIIAPERPVRPVEGNLITTDHETER